MLVSVLFSTGCFQKPQGVILVTLKRGVYPLKGLHAIPKLIFSLKKYYHCNSSY